jgi:hypothetical protein
LFRHNEPSTFRTIWLYLSALPITLNAFVELILQLLHIITAHTRVSNSSYLFVSRNSWNIHFDNHVKNPTALYSSTIAITSSNKNKPARTNLAKLVHRYLWLAPYFLVVLSFLFVLTSTFSLCVQIFDVAIVVIVTITAHWKQFAKFSVTP